MPKFKFFAVLASKGSQLAKNDGVKICRPIVHFLGVHIGRQNGIYNAQ